VRERFVENTTLHTAYPDLDNNGICSLQGNRQMLAAVDFHR
jgi:hypothetical protein